LSRALIAQVPSLAVTVVAAQVSWPPIELRRTQITLPPRGSPVPSTTVPQTLPRNDGARIRGSSKALQASTSSVCHR
jgi:hypothetical protein